jgi:hypothetical protein
MAFARYPPAELDNLVVQLWDKHMRPDWRERAQTPQEVLERWREAKQEGDGAAAFGGVPLLVEKRADAGSR